MPTEPPAPPPPSEDIPSTGRHLYHKEKPAPKPRAAGFEENPTSPMPRTNRNPAMEMMLHNIRRFAWMLLGMALLLVLAVVTLRVIWGIRDRELQSKWGPLPPPPSQTFTTNQATAEGGSTQALPRAGGGGLDTDLIRRAVFLAKHGQALEEAGSHTEAIARYREALDVWPYLTAVWSQLGRLYLKTRDFPRAQIALEKAVENNPGSAELLNDLGVACLYQGRVDKAVDLFEAAVEVDPQYAASYFNQALCHLTRNDRVSARASLRQFLRLKPTDPRALRELAFVDALEKQYENALDSLEKAFTTAPDWPLLYFDAAAVTALMGRPERAVKYLEKAEPLTDPGTVYRMYQEPAFREIRLTELGKLFEKELAARARERMGEEPPEQELHAPSEPLSSLNADLKR